VRRLTILLAAVVAGALLVAPAAHAAVGVEPLKVNLKGATGGGKAFIDPGFEFYRGDPAKEIKCEYKAPGPQTGVCETLMSDEGAGFEQVFVNFEALPGSKITSITRENVEAEACGLFPGSTTAGICTPYVEPPGGGSGEAEVNATFEDEPGEPLIVSIEEGQGTVVSNPAGIECVSISPPTKCWKSYTEPKEVTLTASPGATYAFSSWSGCVSKEGLKCTVKVGEGVPVTVKVKFLKTQVLSVEKASGFGKVLATGISCDESCSKATSAIKQGTAVTVKATPAKGSEFVGFEGGTGDASACSATCEFTISKASSVKVKFAPIPSKTLTVELTGPGAYKGKVTGKGTTVKGVYSTLISCGSGCTSAVETFFATGTTELVATPAAGYKFGGWTVSSGAGTCTGTATPCTLLTDTSKTVKAKFE
jgi:hypothetical protein